MSLADDTENALLDDFVDNYLASTYVALFIGSPLDDGSGGAEVSGNAYARVATPAFTAAAGGAVNNDDAITFPTPTPDGWGTITHFAIYDAATVGNLIAWGELDDPIETTSGNAPVFQEGDLVIEID